MHTTVDDFDLMPQRGGVFPLIGLGVGSYRLDAGCFHLGDLILDVGQFGGFAPSFAPVTVTDSLCHSCANGVEHPFSRVGV